MRMQHLLIIFSMIFLAVALPITVRNHVTAMSQNMNNEYSKYLISATDGCIKSARDKEGESYIFRKEEVRTEAVNVFYKTLSKCFNYDYTTYEELLKHYIPCIFLIDTDGYYVEYTDTYTASDGYLTSTQTLTPINKWSRAYSIGGGAAGKQYIVEYHLDDSVKVIYKDRDGNTTDISGNYAYVYQALGSPSELQDCFSSYEKFELEKNDTIINELQDKLEYYINVYDGFLNQKSNMQYQFTLTQIKGENWSRLIDSPTCISFLQGTEAYVENGYLNIYSFGGSELEMVPSYYVTEINGQKYYHEKDCTSITDADKTVPYTMEQAAKIGAFPHDCVY